MDSFQQFGKLLILFGLIIVVTGVLVTVLGRFGLFRLPGDLEFGGKSWRVYFPVVSCVLVSLIMTLIVWIISYFRR